MTKHEFNYLEKQIWNIKQALLVITNEHERKKLFRRLGGLRLLRDNEINKSYGIVL